MQLDGAIFAIERRSATGCIDLATVFYREHLVPVMTLTAWFAIPSTWLAWFVSRETDSGLLLSLLGFFVLSPFLGACLIASTGRRVFGDEMSVAEGVRSVRSRAGVVIVYHLMVDVGVAGAALFCLVLPGLLVAAQYAFVTEVIMLERAAMSKIGRRVMELTRGGFGQLFGRMMAVAAFYCLVVVAIFVSLDLLSQLVFGFPILIGRIESMVFFVEEATALLTMDTRVVPCFHFVMWLVYPLARLAVFFCYLDMRIRKECWDVELDFRIEAARLAESGP